MSHRVSVVIIPEETLILVIQTVWPSKASFGRSAVEIILTAHLSMFLVNYLYKQLKDLTVVMQARAESYSASAQ